ncbi:MAG: hypothetical protein ABIQ88_02985 [Chitinophagaceae bacterium]
MLGIPENFTVQPGSNSGEVFVYINSVANAKTYILLYVPSPISNEAWLHAVSSQPYLTITGLVPGTFYSFKMAATRSKDQVFYTDIITKMVV